MINHILSEYRMKIVIKYISFCRIRIRRDRAMKKYRGKRVGFSDALDVTINILELLLAKVETRFAS